MCSKDITKPKIVVILGPTASGKTGLALELAQRTGASIVSADSLQIYKYLNIGTAKPTKEEQKIAEHCMIDILNPDQPCNAGIYRELALSSINSLIKENKKIILVGGTFLYVKALLYGLLEDIGKDADYREILKRIRESEGTSFLHSKLARIDPEAAIKIHENDYVRIERALEVFHITGKPISRHHDEHSFRDDNFNSLKIGLTVERENLKERINERVDDMIEKGLVDEVKNIRNLGFSADLKPMQSIGYKQINEYIDGRMELQRAVELIKRDSRRFSRRQLTWLRADEDIEWYNTENNKELIYKRIDGFLD